MNARADIKSHLPLRQSAAIAHERAISFGHNGAVEIFKKTPSIADSKPAGRDVAKDLFDVDGIPLLVETQLADGGLAERLKSRKPREEKCGSGAIRRYARQAGPGVNGAITHRGDAEEKQRYADI
jgi:hypothetical protein